MPRKSKAAFLDRDGTIIEEKNYIADPDDVVFAPRAIAGLRALQAAGYKLVVVTNQSGIARGLYGEAEFHAVQQRLTELLAQEGIHLDAVYYCPHHPDFTGPCDCRKPGPGMYLQAERNLGVDLAESLTNVDVGDVSVHPANHEKSVGQHVKAGADKHQRQHGY